VLGGDVAGAAAVDLEGGDAGHADDVPVAGLDQLWQQRPGHPHRAQHVRLVHPPPLLFVGLGDRIEAERTPGVVDQDIAARNLGHEGGD
jgi:hypothetical protein